MTADARRALVLGATSQIGFFLLPRLIAAGMEVVALTRGEASRAAHDKPGHADVIWRRYPPGPLNVSLGDAKPVASAFFLAPLALLPPLIPELAGLGVQRLIAFGTSGRFYKTASADAAEQGYMRTLIAAEEATATLCGQHSIAWTLFRPTLVYGCGRDRNIMFIANFVRRFGFFPLFSGGRGLRQPVHADDLAHACMQALDNPHAYGKAYILSGGSTLTYREMVEAVFRQLGKPVRTVGMPLSLFQAAIGVARKLPRLRGLSTEMAARMGMDICFGHQEAASDFGFEPRPFKLDALAVGGAK